METGNRLGDKVKGINIPGIVPSNFNEFLKYINRLERLGLLEKTKYNIEPPLGGNVSEIIFCND